MLIITVIITITRNKNIRGNYSRSSWSSWKVAAFARAGTTQFGATERHTAMQDNTTNRKLFATDIVFTNFCELREYKSAASCSLPSSVQAPCCLSRIQNFVNISFNISIFENTPTYSDVVWACISIWRIEAIFD